MIKNNPATLALILFMLGICFAVETPAQVTSDSMLVVGVPYQRDAYMFFDETSINVFSFIKIVTQDIL